MTIIAVALTVGAARGRSARFTLLLGSLGDLINAVYVWIAGVAGDAGANGDTVDDLAITVGAARAGTGVLTFRTDAG